LEYAYTEWCVAQLAQALGHEADAMKYTKRAQSYRNVFDPEVGWFRPKNRNGTWSPWPKEGRLKQDYGSIESNPYQQGWFVPHDLDGLVELLGGRVKALARRQKISSGIIFTTMPTSRCITCPSSSIGSANRG
jgi:putative alpha-1,2-mannosidase